MLTRLAVIVQVKGFCYYNIMQKPEQFFITEHNGLYKKNGILEKQKITEKVEAQKVED